MDYLYLNIFNILFCLLSRPLRAALNFPTYRGTYSITNPLYPFSIYGYFSTNLLNISSIAEPLE